MECKTNVTSDLKLMNELLSSCRETVGSLENFFGGVNDNKAHDQQYSVCKNANTQTSNSDEIDHCTEATSPRGILKVSPKCVVPGNKRKFTQHLLPMPKEDANSSPNKTDVIKHVTFSLKETELLDDAVSNEDNPRVNNLKIENHAKLEELNTDFIPELDTPLLFANIVEIVHRGSVKTGNNCTKDETVNIEDNALCHHSTGNLQNEDRQIETDILTDEVFEPVQEIEISDNNDTYPNEVVLDDIDDDDTMIIHEQIESGSSSNSYINYISKAENADDIEEYDDDDDGTMIVHEIKDNVDNSAIESIETSVSNDTAGDSDSTPTIQREHVFSEENEISASNAQRIDLGYNPLQTLNLREMRANKGQYSRMYLRQFKSNIYKRKTLQRSENSMMKDSFEANELDSPAPLPSPPSGLSSFDNSVSSGRSSASSDSTNSSDNNFNATLEDSIVESSLLSKNENNSADRLTLPPRSSQEHVCLTNCNLDCEANKKLEQIQKLFSQIMANGKIECTPQSSECSNNNSIKSNLLKQFRNVPKYIGVASLHLIAYFFSFILLLNILGPLIEISNQSGSSGII